MLVIYCLDSAVFKELFVYVLFCLYVSCYLGRTVGEPWPRRRRWRRARELGPEQRPTRQQHRGKGVLERSQGSEDRAEQRKTRVLICGGFSEPIAPISLPCGALLVFKHFCCQVTFDHYLMLEYFCSQVT